MSDEQQRVKLAPSHVSAHHHEVELSGSSLMLYWTWDKQEHIRAFTGEETYHLLKFLEQHRSEIVASYEQSCSQCHKPIDSLHTHTEHGVKQRYCSACYRSQFD